ncbi:tocopherol cyclase [Aureococcus anophagefferens]|nr:tocopherol cyclase [Aureococcus anophagefferens]
MRHALAALALLRMAAPLAPSRTPHSGYHGQGSSTPFFEGWYNRLTLPEAETSVALIFAVFDPGARTPRSGVEAQVLVAARGRRAARRGVARRVALRGGAARARRARDPGRRRRLR